MPNYFYSAKTYDGKTKTGTLYADNVHQLAQILKGKDLFLVSAISENDKKNRLKIFLPTFGMSEVEKITMARNLWVMFGAGLPLVKIFHIFSAQTKKKRVKNMMADIAERLSKGEGLSETLARYPNVFNSLFQNMVKIGEESGTLEEVFGVLSQHLDRSHELKTKIRGALIYPGIVMCTMIIIGIIVSTFVLPKFSAFLLGMNIPLPIYTRILIWVGNFSQKFWYLSIILPILIAYFLFLAVKTKSGRKMRDKILMKIPLLASFVKKANAAVLIRSLSSLNASGIAIIRSLEITANTVGNFYFKRALEEAAEKVKRGEKLSASLKPYANLFPFGSIEMMEVGEETGKTSVVLKKLAEFYEQEVIEASKNFAVIIEPILIVILGLAVAFFAISIIEPMYSSLKGI